MPHGLAMRAGGLNLMRRNLRAGEQRLHRTGVGARHAVCRERALMQFIVTRRLQVKQHSAQRRIKRREVGRDCLRRGSGEIDQRSIDAVQAGTRHETNEQAAVLRQVSVSTPSRGVCNSAVCESNP